MVTNFLVQHNLPLATADHLGPLFKTIFPDSKVAKAVHVGEQRHVLLSTMPWDHTVTTTLCSIVKRTLSVLVSMDQVILM